MCNLAGYVGTKQAAPILLELIEKQEGLAGGYYTGIATYDNGKIHYQKLVGDTKRLIKNTDAANLPGTIGIIHSRSKSGGGSEWAHPFVGMKDEEVKIAYIANGNRGKFAIDMQKCSDIIKALDAKGYNSMVKIESDNKNYPVLSDGRRVHMSNAMCELILSKIDEGLTEEKAMESAFIQMPSEIIGLMLSLKNPDRIFYSRINMPMFVGFASHGAYLASAPLAFPEDSKEPALFPALSSGYIKKDGCYIFPYEKSFTDVTEIDSRVIHKTYECVMHMLKTGPKDYYQLRDEVKTIFEKDKCNPYTTVLYEVLYSLKKDNKIKIDVVRCAGAFEDYDAPRTIITLK